MQLIMAGEKHKLTQYTNFSVDKSQVDFWWCKTNCALFPYFIAPQGS
jgi:hypothetical protein